MSITYQDLYGGRTAAAAGSMSPTESASGGQETGPGGTLPAMWLVGLVVALVFVRILYEVA